MIITQKNPINPHFSKETIKAVFLLAAISLFFIGTVYAGTDNGSFDEVWITLKDWTQGTLGRIISGISILVGIVAGIARQSLMAFAIGLGGGIGLYNAPEIIESIFTATIEHANHFGTISIQMSNGLGIM